MRMGAVPPLTENHTMVFPMYVDLDLEARVPELRTEVLERIVIRMNAQVQRFFEDRHPAFECIVCDKSGGAKPLDGGMYKHGVHLQWPELRVTVDQAYELRVSMIAGLDMEDWAEGLDAARVDWDKAVDKAVYAKGLRMVGAPKANKCPKCGNQTARRAQCQRCKRKGVYDPSHYKIAFVVVGDERHEARTKYFADNVLRLLIATTVRCEDETVTPGYQRYVGCPVVPSAGGKRAASPTPRASAASSAPTPK